MSCPACSYANDADAVACNLCGTPLRPRPREGAGEEAPGAATPACAPKEPLDAPPGDQAPLPFPEGEPPFRLAGVHVPQGVAWLLAGIPLGLLLHFVCCGIFGNGARLFFHEAGHAMVSWFFGHPALPTARGFTVTYAQKLPLALLVWGGIGYGVWHLREVRALAGALAVVALLYPLLAFTRSHERLIEVGGHGAEVVFACIFFWRALAGGFVQEAERPVYAALGWVLWVPNLVLLVGILFDPGVRATYESIAICGDNDYVKVSDTLRVSLDAVIGVTLLWQALLPPAVVACWWVFFRTPERTARLGRWLGASS